MVIGDWFIAGMVSFLAGQVMRALRWQLILPNDAAVVKHRLVLFVSLGSLINALLPLRAGDVLRAALLARGARVRLSVSLVSVVIERMTDVFVIFSITYFAYLVTGHPSPVRGWLLVGPAIVLLTWTAIRYSSTARKCVYVISSAWNNTIQHAILDCFWTIVVQVDNARFITFRYLVATLLMWIAYILSYFCFLRSIPTLSLDQVWALFHGDLASGTLLAFSKMAIDADVGVALAVFLLVPIIAAICYSLLHMVHRGPNSSVTGVMRRLSSSAALNMFGVPSAFKGRQAYEKFLLAHFSGRRSALSKVGTAGFGDCKIARVFPGGSGALTAVIECNGKLSIRKVSEGEGIARLKDQYDWLERQQGGNLPVVPVRNWQDAAEYSHYEMPYDAGAVDMYEWLHSVSFERATSTLVQVLDSVSRHHDQWRESGQPAPDLLRKYLEDKVISNITIAREAIAPLIDPNAFRINDEVYSMKEWAFLQNLDGLIQLFSDRSQTDIHGDLTIENLVVNSNRTWMIIDPNPTSIYKTRLMDWGKLLQSLHKGYEGLNRGAKCECDLGSIRFFVQRSDLYHHLHGVLIGQIASRFGIEAIREVELHEIIHYLRLLPYKFRANEEAGLLFFGVTCMLIREFKKKHAIP